MNEFNLPKQFKWEQLSTKLDGVSFIQATSQAETLAYLAQTPPRPGIILLGDSMGTGTEGYISAAKVSDPALPIQWDKFY